MALKNECSCFLSAEKGSTRNLLKIFVFIFVCSCIGMLLQLRSRKRSVFIDEPMNKTTIIHQPLRLVFNQPPNSTHKDYSATIKNIYDRFHPLTTDVCNNVCYQHQDVCKASTHAQWETVMTSGLLKGVPLMSEGEYIFPWEKEYLSRYPLTDLQLLPELNRTVVLLLQNNGIWKKMFDANNNNNNNNNNTGSKNGTTAVDNKVVLSVKQGSGMTFRIDLVNGYGQLLTIGGDEVRAWLSESAPNIRPFKGRSCAAAVEDMGNGSYVVRATPMWSGDAMVNIALTYPRQYIRWTMHQFRLGVNRFILGLFQKGEHKEATICLATPNIPGRPCLCDFTQSNQVPYYCGRPLNPKLTCADWVATWPSRKLPPTQSTPQEQVLANRMSRPAFKSIIPFTIKLNVTPNEKPSPPSPKIDFASSWNTSWPTGYWNSNTVWTSTKYIKSNSINEARAIKCLKKHKVIIVGDSNGVRLTSCFVNLTRSSKITGGHWAHGYVSKNKQHDITIVFKPHKHPLFLEQRWSKLMKLDGITSYLHKNIPLKRSNATMTLKYIVLGHYYYHPSTSHHSSVYVRLKELKDAFTRIISINPDVVLALRGPHISTVKWEKNHFGSGGVHGPFITQMYKDIFWDIRSHVMFLDGWELSIPIQNTSVHPPHSLPMTLVKILLSQICS